MDRHKRKSGLDIDLTPLLDVIFIVLMVVMCNRSVGENKEIAELVKEKKIDGITELRDESDRNGMRICIELRRDVNANVMLNHLENKPVRYLVDDVVKFVKREIRRGNKYDAIIMDPPSYGRGSNGEVWEVERDLENLIKLCKEILSDDFLFIIVNTYSSNLPSISLENILKINFENKKVLVDDLCLPIDNSNLYLSCGITGRVTNE